jgi:hypothetical protein
MTVTRRVLLTLAIFALTATVWSGRGDMALAKSPESDSTASTGGDSPNEPLLLTPRTASVTAKAATPRESSKPNRSAASSGSSTTPSRTSKAPVSDASTTRRSPKPKTVSAAAFQDAPPEEVQPPKPVATKSSQSTPPREEYVEQEYEPAPFPGPNPGYHPARVPRYGAGWVMASMQPARPAAGEMIPAPEETDGADPYMPYGGGGESFDEMIDEGNDYGNYAMPGRRYAFLAGGEGLLLRPHWSQATALTETTSSQAGATTIFNENLINFNPGYQGAFRTYLGIRNCACGDELRFTFLNFNSAESLKGTATSNTSVCDFLCNTTPNPGDSASTSFGMGMSLWDIDCIRPFFCVPPCNNPCGPQCHPWDLRWFAGLRFAYINQNISSVVTDSTASGGIFAQAWAANKFTGFGPRVGLQGRKYFGQSGRFSVYTRGAGSLLVGNDYQSVTNSTPTGQIPTVTNLVSRNSRIIPVAEVELGATWWMLPRFAVSGGWMLMSFWDLGMQATGNIGATPNLDDSNILGFDGFFLRGELVF